MTNGNFHRGKSIFLSVVLLFSIVPVESMGTEQPYDIVITNGHIIDGTGSPWYSGDLAIRDGKIAATKVVTTIVGGRLVFQADSK